MNSIMMRKTDVTLTTSKPYINRPSKKGSLPNQDAKRNFGSGIPVWRRNIPARKATKANSLRRFRVLVNIKLGAKYLLLNVLIVALTVQGLQAKCHGKLINPLRDICWKCIFPLSIAGRTIIKGKPSPRVSKKPVCICPKPPLGQPTPGIPVGFWEPVRLIEIVREPFCFPSMGGLKLANKGIYGHGDVQENTDDHTHHSFYNVHWFIYPVLYWLEVLVDFACLESMSIDLAYLSEIEPLWNDDEKSTILSPEGLLFGNLVAQAACAADCIAATTHLPIGELFWCSGCQGGLYPFTGSSNDHVGGVQNSLLIAGRFMAKLHRQLLLWGTSGEQALCRKYVMPIIMKQQYRFQMVYPIPTSNDCFPMGHSEVLWGSGKEFPYNGSDFAYLVWRKRDCCLL